MPACEPGELAVAVCEDVSEGPFAKAADGGAASPSASATLNARAR